ncbi:60S ribosomal subunit assembly/export protein [Pyricularia oryzae]|uniref:60S ribosomal subunit assembly/export protein LOC1 n=3 Tax=Pyricularia TaxID=48558 RepID=LOC1_PYRO7|nr:60S ribosomal subunit assembly/export protein LOC1 [Pyricularia oryzae 70-15]A4RA36.1 RecName: Full=60S ribosomal subunit assembly/export protein LOC1 [Pyricularia oryzae 70-15]KAH8846791.1 60S ribosomal subunit assembly/export protein [Pyricularia oryzae]KAI6304828.1 60S ribosomal subunit assembly/export protein [Pyricularia grisea]EHA51635.1 60S ribosomal subunit assembly/export protein LOC1 [Pyricularia oryzae 70-15]KAH9428049.1 60S ribosomal subunit assembly/export protein [Pyricularia 
MGIARTKTIKNKHSAKLANLRNNKSSSSQADGGNFVRAKKSGTGSNKPPLTSQAKGRPSIADLLKKKKKRVYTEKELGVPKLNMITPVGVEKPKGKKKGKVFVDDPESINTILAIVQAEKEGQIESKIMKARQMEEIREARRVEAEKKEAERQAKLEDTKNSLRKKRSRSNKTEDDGVSELAATGSKATKAKKKKVAFA